MNMNMESMSMSMGGSSMNMATTTSAMATHVHSAMSMSMPTSSGASTMNMMHMNYYLTREYLHYPVLFEKLYANDKKGAFGIFVLILAACFVYKLLLFVNWTLEIHWFKKWNKTRKVQTAMSIKEEVERDNNESVRNMDGYDSDSTVYQDQNGYQLTSPLPTMPNLMFDIFGPNIVDLFHDFIRILLIFTSTMIIYMLMLAAMSFVLTYVFAVITGLACSEVFFNRCKMALLRRWEVQRELERINKCGGGKNCKCGKHRFINQTQESTTSNNGKTQNPEDDNCCCADSQNDTERNVERNISETTKLQEQGNDMDASIMPPEKFRQ